MASANLPSENPFLTQIERVRVELRERVARAHQVLQERETELLSELQQLEDTYRGEGVDRQIDQLRKIKVHNVSTLTDNGNQELLQQVIAPLDAHMRKLEASLETARDAMRLVELEWDRNLEGILSRTGSIRVSYKKSVGRSVLVSGKHKASSEVKHTSQLTDYAHQLTSKGDPSLSPVIIESKVNSSQQADYTNVKLRDKFQDFDNENTHANPTSGKSQSYSTEPISSSPTSSQEYESATTSQTALSYGSSSSNCSFSSSSTHAHSTSKKQTSKRTHSSPGYTSGTSANFHDTRATKTVFPESIFYEPQQATFNLVEREPIRGLKNLGSTCYMNCILQCLSHTLPLRQFYVSDDYRQYLNNRGDLSTAFKDVMIKLWNTTLEYSVDPYDLKREVRAKTDIFSDNRQHDAHEFLRFLLNELHEEINRASEEGRKSPADNETLGEACARYLTWEDSRISQLFSGLLRSDVCCSICNNQSTAYIPFMDLSLPIPERQKQPYYLYFSSSYPSVHLSDCFKTFTTRETLDGEERLYCNKCKYLRKSTKQLNIAKLPEFLVIHLKRFSYYPKRTKLSTHVEFDDTWKLKDFANNTHRYSLYGIVCHSGSIYGGHYIAYCKYRGVWRCFDDSVVSTVSWKHVGGQEAYVLFYET